MNIKHLQVFSAVYETGSVTRAAETMHLSQPAISKSLAALEAEIGYSLFRREGTGLQPTPEANLLIEDISEFLHGFEQLTASFKRAGRGDRGLVRIAATPGPSLGFLPGLVAEFMRQNPRTNVSLKIRNSASIRELVATGNADIGIADTGLQSPRYDSQPHRMVCLCAVHRSHPAAALDVIQPEDLAGTNWITLGQEHETFHQLASAHQQAGVQFNSTLTVDSSIQALLMVELGAGAAVLDPLSIRLFTTRNKRDNRDVVLKPFQPTIYESIDVHSVNARPMSAAARSMLLYILKALDA
ncbi:LysR family transcriptional regulator [Oricola thermophila]|uniref:LysR family transcriptional regulator n=1 Tax=Oricola thermophila TaxID=2742145 RepID=A0A6N1VH23_9HYPH|nr:LysR family transcriptional regulator [Oricola thermophila]QKV18965.1 LysR family transcriptional regulator [Oricola thermophila]